MEEKNKAIPSFLNARNLHNPPTWFSAFTTHYSLVILIPIRTWTTNMEYGPTQSVCRQVFKLRRAYSRARIHLASANKMQLNSKNA